MTPVQVVPAAGGEPPEEQQVLRAGPLAQALLHHPPGSRFSRDAGADELVWYVRGGTASAAVASSGDGRAGPVEEFWLRTGSALYAPPGWTVEAVVADSGPLDVVEVRAAQGAPVESRPSVVHLSERNEETTGDRKFRVLVDLDVGCQTVTQFVGEIPPGAAPPHRHAYEEVICVLEGHGVLHADGQETVVQPGTSVLLPRGVYHCMENRSDGWLRVLGVFHPSGSPAAKETQS